METVQRPNVVRTPEVDDPDGHAYSPSSVEHIALFLVETFSEFPRFLFSDAGSTVPESQGFLSRRSGSGRHDYGITLPCGDQLLWSRWSRRPRESRTTLTVNASEQMLIYKWLIISDMALAKLDLTLLPQCVTLSRAALISTSAPLAKNRAGKFRATIDRSQMLTYEMAQKPHHIGVRKAWLSWHSQNLEEFRQTQPYQVAQDEIIRRFIRGFFPQNITISGNELVIKRRGNAVYVAGFFQHSRRLNLRRIYWMFGFAEEFLSLLLKQPVKLEIQFVETEHDLAYNYI
uniref:28S ribosomal protein S24, mitochondrial n=1 Tax=Steinernema glaseri TaxID=37863 RepID=A0A1I7XW84_9BILA